MASKLHWRYETWLYQNKRMYQEVYFLQTYLGHQYQIPYTFSNFLQNCIARNIFTWTRKL